MGEVNGIGGDEIMAAAWEAIARAVTSDIGHFARMTLPGGRLRGYQLAPARAIIESVEGKLGRQFAIVFSRQSGKDELLAQVIAYLLTRHQHQGGGIVLAAPTFRPQAALSRDRLLSRLATGVIAAEIGQREGYIVRAGEATARFLSAAPTANARGQTADLLLVANEAQDIDPAIWDAVFDPMAASTNATTVYSGTVWDRNGLLYRQMTHLAALEATDGQQRVWRVPWEQVAAELPAYGERVRARISQLGATTRSSGPSTAWNRSTARAGSSRRIASPRCRGPTAASTRRHRVIATRCCSTSPVKKRARPARPRSTTMGDATAPR